MTVSTPAARRLPHDRVLLARTKLAYIHLHNLLTDAKRDRTGRVDGYVAVWLPDEFVLLFLRNGELVNAVGVEGGLAKPLAIADALARVPAAPEFGEILFHEATPELLGCVYRALLSPPVPWKPEVTPNDPRSLFPHLKEDSFTGIVEIIARDTANYLVLREGLIELTFLCDDGSERSEQLARLFGLEGRPSRAVVRRWIGNAKLPAQAPPALLAVYRELMGRVTGELNVAGVATAQAIAEKAREALVVTQPVLKHFTTGSAPVSDPVAEAATVTNAVAAWVTATLRQALPGRETDAARLLGAAARDRRHLLQAAGFVSAVPWPIPW
jgi:hypothetical protein